MQVLLLMGLSGVFMLCPLLALFRWWRGRWRWRGIGRLWIEALGAGRARRVQVNAAGQAELKLKTPWRDRSTHLGMSPLEFMQRLAARATEGRP